MKGEPRNGGTPGVAQLLVLIGLAAALVLLSHWCGISLCPLKRFTGVPCPTCGTTRAVLLALRGDFADAFAMQPLCMALLVAAGPVALAASRLPRFRRALASAARSPLAWALAALAIAANWAWVVANGN